MDAPDAEQPRRPRVDRGRSTVVMAIFPPERRHARRSTYIEERFVEPRAHRTPEFGFALKLTAFFSLGGVAAIAAVALIVLMVR